MALRISRVAIIPGVKTEFSHPYLSILIETAGKVPTSGYASRLAEICRHLGIEFQPATDEHRDILIAITRIIEGIFEQLRFPIFQKSQVRVTKNQDYEIFFPRMERCDRPAARLFYSIIKILSTPEEQNVADEQFAEIVDAIKELKIQAPKGKNTPGMLRAAHERGIPTRKLWGNVYQFGEGSTLRSFDSSLSDSASALTGSLLQNKILTTSFLREKKFPVPKNFLVLDEKQAILKSEILGYPVVVKPQNRDRGEGVTSLISTQAEVLEAFKKARTYSPEVIVEKHLEGRDYRIHVMNGKAYRVRERSPGGVIGDGNSSIEELITLLNSDPRRGASGSNAELTKIDIDEEAHRMLRKQNLQISDIPSKNQFVRLRSIANVSAGGITNEFPLVRVHPDNIALAESAVKAVNIDIAAVDFITPDIEISWRVAGGGICEINHKPQFGQDAISYLFSEFFTSNGRIPSVMNLGTPFDLGFYESLADRLKKTNIRLGFATAEGAWLGQTRLPGIFDNGVFDAFNLLLENREADAILVNWDAKLKFLGLPTRDLAVLCAIGEVAQGCTVREMNDFAIRSRKILLAETNRKYANEASFNDGKIDILASSEQLAQRLETIIGECIHPNARDNALR